MSGHPLPTPAELQILRALWSLGQGTVHEVRAALDRELRPGYTTVLKLLQVMHGKGLVERDTSRRSHVWRACSSEASTQGRLLSDLAQRAFAGSAGRLVLRALSSVPASPEELESIRSFLDDLERQRS